MIPTAVRYLLRIDDLCPGVSHERWREFRALIEEFRLQPILAVVPDNHDPALQFSKPDSSFWSQIRILESAGATIGLHGFRHLCLSRGRSLLGLHRTSEFAGIPANAHGFAMDCAFCAVTGSTRVFLFHRVTGSIFTRSRRFALRAFRCYLTASRTRRFCGAV